MYHLGRLIDLVVLRHVPKLCGLVFLLLIVLKITGDVGWGSFFGWVALTYLTAFVSGLLRGWLQ